MQYVNGLDGIKVAELAQRACSGGHKKNNRMAGREVTAEIVNIPALASFFDSTAAAHGRNARHQAVVAAATATAATSVIGRRLLVLHGLLALRRSVVLALGRAIVSLRRTVALRATH